MTTIEIFWYSTIGWFQKERWVYFRRKVYIGVYGYMGIWVYIIHIGIFSALVQKRTERKVYASAVDLILTDTVWVLFLSGLASVFLKHTLFSRQNVNRVQIPRICILFYFKLWRAFKISHSIGWGNIIFWAQKVQFHHKLFQKKEIWLNDGADKGKMTMTEGKSKVV